MSRGTKLHNIRVEDGLWAAVVAKAKRCGDTVSDIVRRKLREYLAEPENQEPNQ